MFRRRRAPVTLPLILAAAVLALACSTSSSRHEVAARVSPPDVEPVTITWSYWGDEWEATTNARLARAFERDHPQIKVLTEHRPWSEYFTWLRSEWREGRSPDVMFLNYIPSYAVTGELEPLDRFAATDQAGQADFYPALLDSFRYEDKLYGLPRDNDTKVVYYNRAHFREAGLTEPSGEWTWADLRRAALALTKRDGGDARAGFGFEPSYWWLIWLWQNGGDVLDDAQQPTAVTLDSPENVAALEFLQDLIHVDRVTPPPAQLNTDAMRDLFRQGRLSMVFGNHALVPWFANTAELEWDVAPLPRNAARVNVAGGAGYTVSRRSDNKDAAWQLARYLTSPKAQAILAESGVITPARRSVREDSIFLRQTSYKASVFLEQTAIGRPVPNFPGVTEMERVMDEGLAAIWRGERSPADVLRELAPKVEAVIGIGGS